MSLQFGQSYTVLISLDLTIYSQVWTIVFGAAYTIWIVNGDLHLLASMASSFIWLLLTSVLWVMSFLVPHRGCRTDNNI